MLLLRALQGNLSAFKARPFGMPQVRRQDAGRRVSASDANEEFRSDYH